MNSNCALPISEDEYPLHASVHELKDHVRDSLDVKKNARDHVLLASGVAAALAAAVGYGVAGMFTSR